MHIITRRRLREFAAKHPDADKPLTIWFQLLKSKKYGTPNQVAADFPSASFLGNNRTVFNISGNKYRLVVDIRYRTQRVYIRHVLTHAEYDRVTRDGKL